MDLHLDQLRAFVTASEQGSFSAAARKLGRAQSAVSTAIQNLEIDLGIDLFDRSGKFPHLTEAGEALLQDARQILERGQDMQERAHSLASGFESRVTIATDEMAPPRMLERVLRSFSTAFPRVELECLFAAFSDVGELVSSGRAQMGLVTPLRSGAPQGVNFRLMLNIEFAVVAAPEHPLARQGMVSLENLSEYREIIPTNRGGERMEETSIIGRSIWLAENYFIVRSMVESGVGWAFLPQQLAQESLQAGRIVELPLSFKGAQVTTPLYLLWPRGRRLGPAASWLLSELEKSM
ncbi:LysR family transcriptional regulator [Desulfobaculum bizertense]|uniref:DNA-binding transcriptional regulator, LysR family n=1 Tax=Desulfobaculum bizertense DSM 18034 TaxID=1121442 RepID=A0A1T4VCP8_9BACT|nr:LysR family transcriptional regulator [Desulfobaculum bizertense]UIJ37571.1 LysR family transcriptional regulator [Desulfobaculum bizertense]SKA62732.1 DNA-binding transcriptional regulator, LysR family [Desulfobaculum bizertense DSM 18034]